jgi:hypothetical protein
MATYPAVEDPDAPKPRTIHIRSTEWGHAWPPDAPALCGLQPQHPWHLSRRRATCPTCLAAARRIELGTFWLHETPARPP